MGMLQRAEDKKIFDATLTIKVLKVEDLIGLKVQAMANDEKRKAIDLPDIESLISLYNQFINHQPKPFKPIIDRVMKLQTKRRED